MNKILHTIIQIKDIILLDENPRTISDREIDELCNDIKKDPNFLIQRPPLLNKVDGKLYCYAGTQRIKACKILNYKRIECFIEENIPKEVQIERMLKDNLHRGIWDNDKLLDLNLNIGELESIGFDLNEIGLDTDLFDIPTDLTSENKDNPPTMKITFTDGKQMERFEQSLLIWLEENHYDNVTYSISQGEL